MFYAQRVRLYPSVLGISQLTHRFVCADLVQLAGEVPAGRQQLALPAVGPRMVAVLTSPGYRKAQVSAALHLA